MSVDIDVRGLSCPIPVVKTKKAMEKNPQDTLIILLDSEVSKENVTRLASNMGYGVKSEQSGEEYRLSLEPVGK